jgi:hypothetical protein
MSVPTLGALVRAIEADPGDRMWARYVSVAARMDVPRGLAG